MTTVQDLYNNYSVDHWFELEPWDPHYVNFSPSLIYAGHKIGDVYSAFSSARSYLSDMDCENFGQLITQHDDTHLRYIRSKFLQSSLAFYNYAIDLSWQVVWFYLGDDSYLFLEKPEYYTKYSGYCTYPDLINLVGGRGREDFKQILHNFNANEETLKVRQLYNYVKHRGSLHTKNLGIQYGGMMFAINSDGEEYIPPMIKRKVFDIDEWKERLIQFDLLFFHYFEEIIHLIIPQGYRDAQFGIEEYLNHCLQRLDFRRNEMKEYEERFKQNFQS